MKATATFVKEVNPTARGKQQLYRLDPPLAGFEYVVVSAIGPYTPPIVDPGIKATIALIGVIGNSLGAEFDYGDVAQETFIFGADSDGVITEWRELPGSYQGGHSHIQALIRAGYTVKEGEA